MIGRERTQRSQVVKQADIVALLALLPDEFPGTTKERNFRHYEPRCGHGSSLSPAMHALVAARLGDTHLALRYLHSISSFDPDPGSAGGVRIAGLGGIWQAVALGFAGIDLMGDALSLDPKLPGQWRSLTFCVRWQGRSVAIRIAGNTAQATMNEGDPLDVRIAGVTYTLIAGTPLEVGLNPARFGRNAYSTMLSAGINNPLRTSWRAVRRETSS